MNSPPAPPVKGRLSKAIRVNSANAMVSSAKYTPSMPKRNPSQPMKTPKAAATAIATNTLAQGPMPKLSHSSAET